jgi:hypothetical protein
VILSKVSLSLAQSSWQTPDMDKSKRRKSTNPFDSSSSDEESSSEVFHDCHDAKRIAQLDFNFSSTQVAGM